MKTKKLLPIWLTCLALVFLLPNCNTVKNQAVNTQAIQPPFSHVIIAANTFTVDASKGKTITLTNGSNLVIPKDVFVDSKGNPVIKDVKVSYTEYHSIAEVIISGITMKYDTGGVENNFQTAGMFRVSATSDGKPVFLAQGKSITVNMLSQEKDDDYNFYYLDTVTGKWNCVGKSAAKVLNDNSDDTLAGVATLQKPIMPKPFDASKFVFDIAVNYSQFSELKDFKSIIWQYAGTDTATDPGKHPDLFNYNWTTAYLTPMDRGTGLYMLNLISTNKAFTTVVTPVLRDKDYKKVLAKYNENIKKYTEMLAMQEQETQRQMNENRLERTFAVKNMGIYNCDRCISEKNTMRFAANFDFGDNSSSANNVTVYLITGDNTVIEYGYKGEGNAYFSVDPSQKNCLLAVLPGNKIAVFTSDDFKQVDISQAQASGSYTFHMKVLNEMVSNVNTLTDLLDRI